MKLAIHQPEHFPYLGFFEKMKASDLFVCLDDAQFEKGNFQNRNRFLNANGVEEWFTVPVEKDAWHKNIKDVTVAEIPNWRKKMVAKLSNKFHVGFGHVYEPTNLMEINMRALHYARSLLKITTPMVCSSELKILSTKSQRLVDICLALKADTYLCGQGAAAYFDHAVFDASNIKIEYMDFHPVDYYTILSHI